MQQFLKIVAQEINTRFSSQLHRIAVVFPNRRQAVFFKNYLQQILTPPAFLPELLTIEELIQRSSIYPVADHFVQSFALYDAYAEVMSERQDDRILDYEKFYTIGDILLRDFQELDAYLCYVPKVYEQLKDIEGIEKSFDILSDEQKQFLKTFWSSFSSERKSVQQQKFLELWSMLPAIYQLFHEKLAAQQLTTQGMVYRQLAAEMQGRQGFAEGWQHIAFVGFNAFNKAEETLLQRWQAQGKASLWMDIDDHYTANPQHEAGHFIRRNLYKLQLKTELPLLKEIGGKTIPIQVISAQGSVAQTKYLPQWLNQLPVNVLEDTGKESIAIILADEGLLLPVLQSLPPELGNVNVTMGYPLKQSVLFSFIQSFFLIQTDLAIHHDRDISHEQVQAFLQHPLCDWADAVKQNLQYRMVNEVLLRIPIYQLQGHSDIGNYVFSPLHKATDIFGRLLSLVEAFHRNKKFETDSLLQGLLVQVWQSVQQLKGLFMGDPVAFNVQAAQVAGDRLTPASPRGEEPKPATENGTTLLISQPLTGEAPLSARRGAGGEASERTQAPSLPFLTQSLRKQLSTISVPFEGEPLQGIQVMGLLESRGLDFDHIIILSANEGILPRIQTPNSFLPDSIRRAFGLSVPEHQDAIFAYAFYRLLHRCQSMTLMYNATISDQSTGEPSRFVPQLEFETNFKIDKTDIRFELKSNAAAPITIEKTAEVMKQFNPYFMPEKAKTFSPSAINSYIHCQLQFYFRYLARLKEPDEIQDEVDAAVFGNIVHNLMELLYNAVKEKNGHWNISRDDIAWMKTQVPILLPQAFIDGWREKSKKPVEFTGRLLVVAEVVKQYANAYLDYDAGLAPFTIEALETKFNEAFYITVNGRRRPVYFSGYIDRVDIVAGIHRMVDYKTGADEMEFTTVEKLFDSSEKKRNKAALQTLIYAWSFSRKFPEKARFEPALLPLRVMQEQGENFNPRFVSKVSRTEKITISADTIHPVLHQLEDHLRVMLEELFDTGIPFAQTDDVERCTYCPYIDICGRG
ncbi:MAG: PD-(D/E)XK nuclease family protein [Bacteroidota bacterium]